jgi:hypothetical protein
MAKKKQGACDNTGMDVCVVVGCNDGCSAGMGARKVGIIGTKMCMRGAIPISTMKKNGAKRTTKEWAGETEHNTGQGGQDAHHKNETTQHTSETYEGQERDGAREPKQNDALGMR